MNIIFKSRVQKMAAWGSRSPEKWSPKQESRKNGPRNNGPGIGIWERRCESTDGAPEGKKFISKKLREREEWWKRRMSERDEMNVETRKTAGRLIVRETVRHHERDIADWPCQTERRMKNRDSGKKWYSWKVKRRERSWSEIEP